MTKYLQLEPGPLTPLMSIGKNHICSLELKGNPLEGLHALCDKNPAEGIETNRHP
jgi:hypothetical protein